MRDAIARFTIPLSLLDELVAGITMDLKHAATATRPDTYATFADLYRYCYLVASVVGLVCIRIFGYTDPRAEKLAEETGIAFQLTNILRDVAEDAERNRVYLPLEDLAAHHVSLDSLLHRMPGAPPTVNERALLKPIRARAEHYYQSAQELLPLIDRESRPALWVLVSIYHGLLKRIRRATTMCFRAAPACRCGEAGDSGGGPGADGVGAAVWAMLKTFIGRLVRHRSEAIRACSASARIWTRSHDNP